MATYNFKEIEKHWQKEWEKQKTFSAPEPTPEKPAYYILVMFPYPSGNLHMGHVRNYTIGDVLARFHRTQGRSVLHPIGWDAFGLPAENAAIKRKVEPSKWTYDNIAVMREQLKALGISYDWDREFATCDPTYYQWNQWLFIKMFEKGLAYRKKAPVNWCESCQTVLANEQVHDGRCWRCDNPVIEKELEQWFFRITDYAEELLTGHKLLGKTDQQKGWPEQVITMQKNWIGESWGALVDFRIVEGKKKSEEKIRVFTTRPDTLFGATFMVLAPEHPLVEKITTPDRKTAVDAYRARARQMTKIARTSENREKTGEFTGCTAENPMNGKAIPVWIADYVLPDYGTGAIMAVPAHDERDHAFATKFGIDIIEVIKPQDVSQSVPGRAFTDEGVLVNSGEFTGFASVEAKQEIASYLDKRGLGGSTVTYKLRDWLLSRQRYWGTPIPMIYCSKCGVLPVPLKDLPVILPKNVQFTGTGASPLSTVEDWVKIACPKCGGPGRRETDTMDTFVDSSWYYTRYTDPKNDRLPFDMARANKWIPIHQYVGGIEHACMHLIYSRFFHKVMRDMGLIDSDEPFASLLTQGMVTLGGSAMSKSRGNVVDPNEVIERYGADTCRLFILFAAPPTQQLEWSDKQIEGIWRFLNRVWRLAQVFLEGDDAKQPKRTGGEAGQAVNREELERMIHITIKRVTDDISRDFGFNTAISAIMELVNAIYLYPDVSDSLAREAVEVVLQLLSPFAPHMTEELWNLLGHKRSLSQSSWPESDPEKMTSQQVEIIVQVNGKLRDRLKVAANAPQEEVSQAALKSLEARGVKIVPQRVIYVPNKLVNFVQ